MISETIIFSLPFSFYWINKLITTFIKQRRFLEIYKTWRDIESLFFVTGKVFIDQSETPFIFIMAFLRLDEVCHYRHRSLSIFSPPCSTALAFGDEILRDRKREKGENKIRKFFRQQCWLFSSHCVVHAAQDCFVGGWEKLRRRSRYSKRSCLVWDEGFDADGLQLPFVIASSDAFPSKVTIFTCIHGFSLITYVYIHFN